MAPARCCGAIHVLLQTNPFKPDEPQCHPSITVPLINPTSDTRELTKEAFWGLKRIFRVGYAYKKAGVMLMEIGPENQSRQCDLFSIPVAP